MYVGCSSLSNEDPVLRSVFISQYAEDVQLTFGGHIFCYGVVVTREVPHELGKTSPAWPSWCEVYDIGNWIMRYVFTYTSRNWTIYCDVFTPWKNCRAAETSKHVKTSNNRIVSQRTNVYYSLLGNSRLTNEVAGYGSHDLFSVDPRRNRCYAIAQQWRDCFLCDSDNIRVS
jgi:hypothetical protein